MNIDNSRVFIADVKKKVNVQNHVQFVCGDSEVGYTTYDTVLVRKNVLLVKFSTWIYVPVAYLQTMSDYKSVASHVSKDGSLWRADERFLDEGGIYSRFISKPTAFFAEKGSHTLKELCEIQHKLLNKKSPKTLDEDFSLSR